MLIFHIGHITKYTNLTPVLDLVDFYKYIIIAKHAVDVQTLYYVTGFPKKDALFSKLQNIIIENIDFRYLSDQSSFIGNPVPATKKHLNTVHGWLLYKVCTMLPATESTWMLRIPHTCCSPKSLI